MLPETLPRTRTVWRQNAYGSASAVTPESAPIPPLRRDQVLVRMSAVSLNSGDVHLMTGEPRLLRLFLGLRRPRIRGRGMDLAGTVVALGDGVEAFAVGDAVVGAGTETLADYVAVAASRLTKIPDAVDPRLAATLPIAGNTAVTALDAGRVGAGSRVLVVGAGGGVGTLTVQLAADRGAEVWATCGARAEGVLRERGASRTFDYRTTSLDDLPAGSFDAVVEIAGEPPLAALARLARPHGRIVVVGGEGHPVLGPVPRMLRALFSRGRFRYITAVTRPAVNAELLRLVADGGLTPAVERTWPLSEASDALAWVEGGHTVGKVVVTAN
ncbi:NAD(P)-dependent alcohol dehydrogenase [Microbacterium sp. RD1]|uniref:NAD(P)-dependent alcohol dehydrogenase n=1 Tax=Microbacterium sp. RD1 TaxID=3457313 RepID=UPI003FA5234B